MKFLLILCLGLFAVQVCSTDVSDSMEDLGMLRINLDPKASLEKLKDAAKKTFDNAKAAAQASINTIKTNSQEILKKSKQEIQKSSKKLLQNLDNLKAKAKKLGVDISKCTKHHEDDLKMMPIKLSTGMIACVTNKVEKAEKIIKHAVKTATETYKKIIDLGSQVNKCGSGSKRAKCVTKIVAKITTNITVLTMKISSDILKATNMVRNLKRDMEKCAALNISEMAKDGGQVLVKITECVNKLHHAKLL